MPSTIEQLTRELRGQRFAVLAVNIQESRDRVAAWVKEQRVSSRVLFDFDGAVASAYRVTATPTVVLIDKQGRMVARGAGTRPWTGPHGRALLEALLRRDAR